MSQYLDKALQELAVGDEAKLVGVVDPRHASVIALRALPGIDEQTASRIYDRASSRTVADKSVAWLAVEGLVTLQQFRQIEPLLTPRSTVFHFHVVGFSQADGVAAHLEVVIDATSGVPMVLRMRELPVGRLTASDLSSTSN
jgi:hypothetical protein